VETYKGFAAKMDIKDVQYVPISALKGDNVVERSKNMDWFKGPTLMYLLENIHIASDYNHIDARLPVQFIIRPQKVEGYHDYRGFAGRITSGIFRKGDEVTILPSGFTSTIKSIREGENVIEEAYPPMSIAIELEDDLDISRGDMIVKPNNQPEVNQDIDTMLCWFSPQPLKVGGKYVLRHTTAEVRTMIKDVVYKMDINELQKNENDKDVKMNDIARIKLRTTKPLFFDPYKKNRETGSLILVDEATNNTVAAGMIR
jgi:sulfate adenylyltransferase subunit 1